MDTEIPKWLIVFVSISWYASFSIFFSGMLLSTALQDVVQYEKTPCRLWYWLWCFNMGALYCFLQRAHGVFVTDCNICCPCDSQFVWHFLHHMFDVLVFQLFTSRIVNESAFVVLFLHKRNTDIMHHRGGGYSSLLSVLPCMKCVVGVFRFHTLRETTQREVFKCEITWFGKLSMLYL